MLLSGIKHKELQCLKTLYPIDIVIFDKQHNKTDIDTFLNNKLTNLQKDCSIITMENDTNEVIIPGQCDMDNIYSHTVLGGTFDRLHIAHKLLLTETVLRATTKVTVGVTEDIMLTSIYLLNCSK